MPDSPTTGPRPIRRALLSVSDKTGLVPFARGLVARGVALICAVLLEGWREKRGSR